MPAGNGTGPMGAGQMTGWGRGYCRGSEMADVPRGDFGGWRQGRGGGLGGGGGGRGWRNWYRATGVPGRMRGRWEMPLLDDIESPPEVEQRVLEQRSALLESELELVKARLAELGASASEAE